MEITLDLIRDIDNIIPIALEYHEQIWPIIDGIEDHRTAFHYSGWKGNRLHMRWCLFSEIDRRIRKGIVVTQEMVEQIYDDIYEDFNND